MEMTESVDTRLGRIEGKLDVFLVARAEDAADKKELVKRVESLEKFKWMLFGGATAVTTLVNVLMNVTVWHK